MGGCMDRLRLDPFMLTTLWVLGSFAKGAARKPSNIKCTGQVNFKFARYVKDNEVNLILDVWSVNCLRYWNSWT